MGQYDRIIEGEVIEIEPMNDAVLVEGKHDNYPRGAHGVLVHDVATGENMLIVRKFTGGKIPKKGDWYCCLFEGYYLQDQNGNPFTFHLPVPQPETT